MLFSRHCYSNGHENISTLPCRATVRTSEHEFMRSLPKELRNFSFNGQSKHYSHFSTFPCSYSSLALPFSLGTLISQFSSWHCRGSAFARLSMDHVHASLPSQQPIHPSLVSSVAHCYCNTISGISDSLETNILDIFCCSSTGMGSVWHNSE